MYEPTRRSLRVGCDEVHELTAGERHNCVLTADREVLCWGYNGAGQLGNGTAADAVAPVLAGLNCQ